MYCVRLFTVRELSLSLGEIFWVLELTGFLGANFMLLLWEKFLYQKILLGGCYNKTYACTVLT